MYAIAIIRHGCPIEEVVPVLETHRAYLRTLRVQGTLLAAGPFNPRIGGALLLRITDSNANAALDRIRDNDPYWQAGIAQYELLPWNPVIGVEDLDRI